MLEQEAPVFKPYYGYLSFAGLYLFSSLKVVSRLRMWGWQGKEDFLEQEQKTSDYVLWQQTSSHPVDISGESCKEGGRLEVGDMPTVAWSQLSLPSS